MERLLKNDICQRKQATQLDKKTSQNIFEKKLLEQIWFDGP